MLSFRCLLLPLLLAADAFVFFLLLCLTPRDQADLRWLIKKRVDRFAWGKGICERGRCQISDATRMIDSIRRQNACLSREGED